ncbi:LAFA_0C10264g1_1 [Lachancea sp. 'fantastica']|nr:LAFA_0C10264g1_1 [Lachancea sp. 'fantastica']
MGARRSRNRSAVLLAAGALTALVLGAFYVWGKGTTSSSSSSNVNEKDENAVTVCIVLTDDMYEDEVDWEKLLSLQAVVVLPPKTTASPAVARFPTHQLIRCGTEEGVWSVVRHLRKDIVVVSPLSFNSVPADVHRYSELVTELP